MATGGQRRTTTGNHQAVRPIGTLRYDQYGKQSWSGSYETRQSGYSRGGYAVSGSRTGRHFSERERER